MAKKLFFSIVFILITICSVFAQQPGVELARISVAEVERVPFLASDGLIGICRLRIRWMRYDLERYYANFSDIALGEEYVKNFLARELSQRLGGYLYEDISGILPDHYPYEPAEEYQDFAEAFVSYINEKDMILSSRGIQVHSIDIILREPN